MHEKTESLPLAHPHLNHVRRSLNVNHLHRVFGDDAQAGAICTRHRGDELAIVPEFEDGNPGDGVGDRAKFGFHFVLCD